MEPILEWGIGLIEAFQSIESPALDALFEGITFLGNAEFYLLLAPIIIWCVNYGLGARLGILLLFSSYLNEGLKNLLMQPRPCEPRPDLCKVEAEGHGLPSGHAQNAVVFWGLIANWIAAAWAWVVAMGLMVLIGLSRIYLGVHFPTDVLVGWAIGIVLLGVYLLVGKRVEKWIAEVSLTSQVILALAVPALLLAIQPTAVIFQVAGVMAGLGVGVAVTHAKLDFDAGGRLWKRAVRFLLGVAVVALLFFGLRLIFPGEGQALYTVFRFVRYLLIGFWISFAAPWVFLRLNLAGGTPAGARS